MVVYLLSWLSICCHCRACYPQCYSELVFFVSSPVLVEMSSQIVSFLSNRYGDCLVVVASQKLREAALWGKSDSLAPVNDRQFCILELIGRARDQGVTQRGVHSYFKLDPRSCFYDVRMLAKYKFITMQVSSFSSPLSSFLTIEYFA